MAETDTPTPPKKSPITIWATAIATILTAATGLVLGLVAVYSGEDGAKKAYTITKDVIERQQKDIEDAWKDIDKANDRIDVLYAMLIGKVPTSSPHHRVKTEVEEERRSPAHVRMRMTTRRVRVPTAHRRPTPVARIETASAAVPDTRDTLSPDAGVGPDITMPKALKRVHRAPRRPKKAMPAWGQVQQ
jgi:hypothetical protein